MSEIIKKEETPTVQDSIFKGFSNTIGLGLLFLFVVMIAPLVGMLSGYIMSLIIPNIISDAFLLIGLHIQPYDFYKVGALLAWIGCLTKYTPEKKEKR